MYKSTVKTVLKRRNTESHYKPEEMTNFLSHKGNANQKDIEIWPHSTHSEVEWC
jgi:hypothetical protein